MKKLDTMLLFLSLPLILGACGGSQQSSSSGASGDDKSEKSSEKSAGSDASMTDPSGSDESVFISSVVSPVETTSIDYTIGWTQEVLDVMEPHLGGHAIPFIDLPGRILATWIEASSTYDYSQGGYITEEAHLSILSTGGFDAALAGAAKMTYQKAGWNVDFDRAAMKMHAEDPDLGIKVDFYGEYDQNDNMTNPQIDVYYNEPFVIPVGGSWRNATLEVLASIGVEAPHALPYVYMGTMAEEAIMVSLSNGSAVEIQGRVEAWDVYENDILGAARSALPRSKKWFESVGSVTSGTGYYASSYTCHTFTKSFSDGYVVTASLYGRPVTESYYSSSPKTPFLRVSCTQN